MQRRFMIVPLSFSAIVYCGQHNPSPFGETTSIAVSVPKDVQSAFLYFYKFYDSAHRHDTNH